MNCIIALPHIYYIPSDTVLVTHRYTCEPVELNDALLRNCELIYTKTIFPTYELNGIDRRLAIRDWFFSRYHTFGMWPYAFVPITNASTDTSNAPIFKYKWGFFVKASDIRKTTIPHLLF